MPMGLPAFAAPHILLNRTAGRFNMPDLAPDPWGVLDPSDTPADAGASQGPAQSALRADLRTFLRTAALEGRFESESSAWHLGFDPSFSLSIGERGWIGIDWPVEHGGGGGSHVDRQIVVEELLAAGAPVAAHWLASQVGLLMSQSDSPTLLSLLPAMARGEVFISLGLQEEGQGSDWTGVRTTATRSGDGWLVSGTKQWVSHAHRSHYALVLARTSGTSDDGDQGLSQFLVDLAEPGVQVHPVYLLDGNHQVNSVVLDDVFVPDAMMLGAEGEGWPVLGRLFHRFRGGPQRFMGHVPLLVEVVRAARAAGDEDALRTLGLVVAQFAALRSLSADIARRTDLDLDVSTDSGLVMNLGYQFDQRVIDLVGTVVRGRERGPETVLGRRYADAVLYLPVMQARNGPSAALLDSLAASGGS